MPLPENRTMQQEPANFKTFFLNEVDSTNDYALERIGDLAHHSLIVSDTQTKGRGRRQRYWHSSVKGNLYMSLVEKQLPPTVQLQNFTQLMAVAVVAACRLLAGNMLPLLGIKWPNDIFYREKKVGGILSESRFSGSECRGLVVGLGLNIVAAPELAMAPKLAAVNQQAQKGRYQAVALNDFLDPPIDRDRLISAILAEYYSRYSVLIEQGYPGIAAEYEALLVHTEGGFYFENIYYYFAGINSEGELRGRSPAGGSISLRTGDISWHLSSATAS